MSKITKRVVDGAGAEAKRYIVWDVELKGFGLLVLRRPSRATSTNTGRQKAGSGVSPSASTANGRRTRHAKRPRTIGKS